MNSEKPQILCESKYLRLVRAGHWDYAQRTNTTGAVIIVALTEDQCVLFVEQYRIPVQATVIEFPAGIVGDDPSTKDEPLASAAQRELLEETGYACQSMTPCFTGASSAGLTDEMATFCLARNLSKVSAGGGVEHERITIHEVPLVEADAWLEAQAATGKLLDSRLYSGLYLLHRMLKHPPSHSSKPTNRRV